MREIEKLLKNKKRDYSNPILIEVKNTTNKSFKDVDLILRRDSLSKLPKGLSLDCLNIGISYYELVEYRMIRHNDKIGVMHITGDSNVPSEVAIEHTFISGDKTTAIISDTWKMSPNEAIVPYDFDFNEELKIIVSEIMPNSRLVFALYPFKKSRGLLKRILFKLGAWFLRKSEINEYRQSPMVMSEDKEY